MKKRQFSWFEKSAKAGLPLAAGNVGNCYFYGRGVKKDLEKAKHWYEIGAKAGLQSSMLQLGVILKTQNKNKEAFQGILRSRYRWICSGYGLARCLL